MPRYPRWGPYKTSIVSSSSKKTHKHMTTIPKPIMTSDWSFWKIIKVEKKIVWEAHGYDAIVSYLSNRLTKILSEEMEGIKQGDDCVLIQIRVKKGADIHLPTSWHVGLRFERKILMEGMMKRFAKGVRGVEDDKQLDIKGLGKFNLNDLAIQFSLLDDFEAEYKKNIEIYKSAIRSIVNYNLIEQNYLEE